MIQIEKILSEELSITISQVTSVIKLLDEGNTIPFIARYRKEMTNGMDDAVLRDFKKRLDYLNNLQARKDEVIKSIKEQDKLTNELQNKIENAMLLNEVEDLYRPFKKKKRTKATIAKELGLEPLALYILNTSSEKDIEKKAVSFINKEVTTVQDAILKACDIIAEWISDNADYRKYLKNNILAYGVMECKAKTEEDSVYRNYYDYNEQIKNMPAHRVLAINRGEKENILSVKLLKDDERLLHFGYSMFKRNRNRFIETAVLDGYKRLLIPSIEREIRNILNERAQEASMKVFAKNLEGLLMMPPVRNSVVLGLDPAYRTGCKIAIVDDTGKVLNTSVIYPTPPQNKVEESKQKIIQLCMKYGVDIISIGNGTATKEAEIFVSQTIKEIDRKIKYLVVSEAGASVYSASELASKEFPQFDVSLRSAVSIARRLQDPLAELVKIDPKAIGVGQYQHDMNQKELSDTLGGVVENCVNEVGVDVNTASSSLLSYISGINKKVADNVVMFREEKGKYLQRKDLLKVKGLGEKAYLQAAGFLRIQDGKELLDSTAVHPESYDKTYRLLDYLGYKKEDYPFKMIFNKAKEIGLDKIAQDLDIGQMTLEDILKELTKPYRDPRDELPQIELREELLAIDDLKPGMILKGTVRNVANFGAFIDLGVHQDGLVHISQLANRFVKDPNEIVKVGDVVKVKILSVDKDKNRISLTMKDF